VMLPRAGSAGPECTSDGARSTSNRLMPPRCLQGARHRILAKMRDDGDPGRVAVGRGRPQPTHGTRFGRMEGGSGSPRTGCPTAVGDQPDRSGTGTYRSGTSVRTWGQYSVLKAK